MGLSYINIFHILTAVFGNELLTRGEIVAKERKQFITENGSKYMKDIDV